MSVRLLFVWLVVSSMGCSITQHLPEDEYLYLGSALDIEAADSVDTEQLEIELLGKLNQTTNSKIPLIGYRNIWRYYKFEEKKRNKPYKYLDDPDEIKGEKPIFFDETVVESVNNLLENTASNNGYFNNEASYTLDTLQDPPAIKAAYTVAVGTPYTVDSITYFWRDTAVAHIIDPIKPASVIEPGDRYDLDAIKAERYRWQQALKNNGYFYADDDDFLFLADTVTGDHDVELLAKLKTDVPKEHLIPQRIREINVYPRFDVSDTSNLEQLPQIEEGGLNIRCADCPLRPSIIDEAFAMEAGDLYDPERHRKTLRRLASYNTFRYISLDYEQVPGSDSTLILNAYMDPLLRRRIEGEIGLTYNSAQYVGPNVRLAYTNRNLLRGAELFQLEGDFSYAVFLGNSEQIRVPTSGIYGLTATLNVPRLWLPARRKLIPRLMTSGTVISLGAKLESLSLTLSKFEQEIALQSLTDLAATLEADPEASERVSLLQIRAQYGYTWQRRVKKIHLLNPFSVRIQNPVISNDEVLEIARSLGVSAGGDGEAQTSRFDRMVVFSPNYTLTYDTRLDGEDNHNFFWQQYLSMNVNNVFPIGPGLEDAETVRSLYPQLETDLRYYWKVNSGLTLASRIHGGIAFPLSERVIVPYFDLYSIGGPNSLRGFAPRQLGPGRTAPVNNNLLTLGGYGNLMLESSIELRQKVTPIIELAAFIDAGNLWTYKTELEPLDTDFRQSEFIDQLAMNAGIGFRFDLTFLIFRLDLAKPFQIPYEETVADFAIPQKFVGDPVDDSIRLVIAFGYPF
ncbi:Outer membrane protein assembly factor BamA [Neolewinella maritima]|uniref:Outer membrane protein assembly factor BamA n=1 Tax=Neolewinella maritima TaxID=1383882 RepID=A0ABM9B3X7_9BACT|nr:BamA/TamA family outer membrane protein [Neolewinella maritima]CAH1002043.1 Outer membrane protein assembly factor BamA [Neolewinella maritima]